MSERAYRLRPTPTTTLTGGTSRHLSQGLEVDDYPDDASDDYMAECAEEAWREGCNFDGSDDDDALRKD